MSQGLPLLDDHPWLVPLPGGCRWAWVALFSWAERRGRPAGMVPALDARRWGDRLGVSAVEFERMLAEAERRGVVRRRTHPPAGAAGRPMLAIPALTRPPGGSTRRSRKARARLRGEPVGAYGLPAFSRSDAVAIRRLMYPAADRRRLSRALAPALVEGLNRLVGVVEDPMAAMEREARAFADAQARSMWPLNPVEWLDRTLARLRSEGEEEGR